MNKIKNFGERVLFTEDMRRTHTILVPDMLPHHFRMLAAIMNEYGYRVEMLENRGVGVTENGLKYVHNDSCYPAQLVIGQFIDALNSGKYDTDRVAFMFSQTGGGCRASNYISLLRKALKRAGYGHIPVISLNFQGLESNPGFKLTLPMLTRMMYAVLYGDLLMLLVNRCRPYELEIGRSAALASEWTESLTKFLVETKRLSYKKVKAKLFDVVKSFSDIPCDRSRDKLRVGIVGEIYVKYSPLGNNSLEDFLVSEGCEPVMAGFLDFAMFFVYNCIADYKLYHRGAKMYPVWKFAYRLLQKKQKDINEALESTGLFRASCDFEKTRSLVNGYLGIGMKMGEGWLLTAEMLEHIENGVSNIVCVQPFGCLPNHIAGRGVMNRIKASHPHVNIAAIDYDPSTSPVNQHNRIKLMLSGNEEPRSEVPTEKQKQTDTEAVPV